MANPNRYYTFAPGKAPRKRKADEIQLGKGQFLRYRQGSGYYASYNDPALHPSGRTQKVFTPGDAYTGSGVSFYHPPPRGGGGGGGGGGRKPPPKAPVRPWWAALTPAQIEAQAAARARGALAPQTAEIRRQQAYAMEQARLQGQQIQGFAQAAAGMEGQYAPQVSQAYSTATQDIGALGQGMATGVQRDLAAAQATDAATALEQGQQTADTTDTAQLHDTIYGLNALIPGESLAAQGAAAAHLAAGVPQIQLNAGREQLQARMAQAHADNDEFAKQLINIAAQFPEQKAQALKDLNQYELDKAEYRERVRQYNLNYGLQKRAEIASEKAAGQSGMTEAQKDLSAYRWAGLEFKNKQEADKAKTSGKVIDVAASKAMGYVIYKDGSFNKNIKVDKGGSASQRGAQQKKQAALVTASSKAYTQAQAVRGKAVPAVQRRPTAEQGPKFVREHPKMFAPPMGAYKARPGVRGVFPDGTTNNEKLAVHAGGATDYNDAQRQVFAAIGGEQLMARFNMSWEQVMAIVNKQLRRAGWKRRNESGSGPQRGGADVG